jgi:hypothetical protein
MPKRSSKKSKPADLNQLARAIVSEATDEPEQQAPEQDKPTEKSWQQKNPAAVALGKLGGKKGGPARAKKLTAERRKEIAQKAAETRWSKRP